MHRVRIASVHLLHLLESKIRIRILMSNFLSRIKVSNNSLIKMNLHYLIIVAILTKILIEPTIKGTCKLNSKRKEMEDTKFQITIVVSFRVKVLFQDNNQLSIIEIFQLIMLLIRRDNCLTDKLPKNKPPS